MRKLLLVSILLAVLATGAFLLYTMTQTTLAPKVQTSREIARARLAKLQPLSDKACLCRLVGGQERVCEQEYLAATKTMDIVESGFSSMPTSAMFACLPDDPNGQPPHQNDCIERGYALVVANAKRAIVCTPAQNYALNAVWNRVYRQTGSYGEAGKALMAAYGEMKREEIERQAKATAANPK